MWASQPSKDDDMGDDARLFNLLPDAPTEFTIEHENWIAWLVFVESQDQWIVWPDGKLRSLNAASVKAVIDLFNPDDPLETFRQVRAIQMGVRHKMDGKDIETVLYGET